MDNFIFKGISSESLKVIVNSLPPITKPNLRVEETVISGVDGAIYEDLGYETYEKTIRITITENNADEIINWLKGEGDLTLSNEPDKYYRAKMINQIDFQRLIKYEPVEITFRVQPFKYKKDEEYKSNENTIVKDTNITIDKGISIVEASIFGKTEQETYSGKNIFDIQNKNFGGNNIDAVIEENSITATRRTANSGTSYRAIPFKCEPNTTYKINGTAKVLIDNSTEGQNFLAIRPTIHGGDMIAQQNLDKSSTKEQNIDIEFNSGEYTELTLWLYLSSEQLPNVDVSVIYNNLMISTNGGNYEPYVGGKASPSPDYPQEIEVATGSVSVKSTGKNLLKPDGNSSTAVGLTFTNNEDGTFTIKGTATSNRSFSLTKILPTLKKNKNYTLSLTILENTGETFSVPMTILNEDGTPQYNYFALEPDKLSQTNLTDREITTSAISLYVANGKTVNATFKVQLEENDVATEYQEYQESSITYNLGDNFLADKDYIQDGVLNKNVGKVVIDTSKIEFVDTYTNVAYAKIPKPDDFIGKGDFLYHKLLCTCASSKYINSWDLVDNVNVISAQASTNNIFIGFAKGTTLEQMKTYLTGAEIYYELATPEQIPLETTGELITLGEKTYISNSEDTEMQIEYINEYFVVNVGLEESKPIIHLEGDGHIEFKVNGKVQFTYDFPSEEIEVYIDCEKQDAYVGDVLKNRNMNGEFPVLEVGENRIEFTGHLKKIDILPRSRWL